MVKLIFQAKLLRLTLDHNSIETLRGETLFGLESLQYLSLSHNSLTRLQANLTCHAPNIKTLGRARITLLSFDFIKTLSNPIFFSKLKL